MAAGFKSKNPFLVLLALSLATSDIFADEDSRKTPPLPTVTEAEPPKPDGSAPFRPSVAVIVGVLTTAFSVTFLLLLYAKHCKRGGGAAAYGYPNSRAFAVAARKNSGIDRAVVESLPVFRFASLMGQKEGLECAVCLNRFEPRELLRLLPKCRHAFHVECVDTWLDAHSTCPLCRYRVDAEDILLVEDNRIFQRPPPQNAEEEDKKEDTTAVPDPDPDPNRGFRRISGRHSSAGELKRESRDVSLGRHSLDSRTKTAAAAAGGFGRKDGLLLTTGTTAAKSRLRLEHRIVVSAGSGPCRSPGLVPGGRWSDLQPSDLLYLRSEMIISDSRRTSSASASRPSFGGRNVINSRSLSEITGLNRRSKNDINHNGQRRQAGAGLVSRWLAWISPQTQPQPAVRSGRTPTWV